jgi:hypothetical protein
MTANEIIHKIKYENMLSTLDIPMTIDGKDIIDIEFVTADPRGDGSYGSIIINLKSKEV